MKYIEQYIKRNYPNTIVTQSDNSNSKYLNVNGFYIRISDHLSPLMKHTIGTCHLEIIKPFGETDNFIIIHTPTMRTLTKQRKDVNTFTKNLIEVHNLEKDCTNFVKVKKSSVSLDEIIETMTIHNDWGSVGTLCGRTKCWLHFTKEQKKQLKNLYNSNEKLTTKQFLKYLSEIPKQKTYSNNVFNKIIINLITLYKLNKV